MQKEKHVKASTRKTKSGKVVRVRAYSAKYDASDEVKKSLTRKKGAGDELKTKVAENTPYGFSKKEWDAWYDWDMQDDADNPEALKVEKALIAQMGKRAYNRYVNECVDSYTPKGSTKAYKSFAERFPVKETPAPKKEKPQVQETTPPANGRNVAEKSKTESWRHVSRVDGKFVRPLSENAHKFLQAIKDQGVKLPKGFSYNDILRHEDQDSFTSSSAKDIKELVRQVKSKKWEAHSFDKDGKKHTAYISPDKSMRVIVRGTGAKQDATFFATAPLPEDVRYRAEYRAAKTSKKSVSVDSILGKLSKPNKAGERSVALNTMRRHQLIGALQEGGWSLSHKSESDANTYMLFTKGKKSIAVNTGSGEFFDDVIVR